MFAAAAPSVLRYGLTYDEPTYAHFAALQRDWFGDLLDLSPRVFTQEVIHDVWLQDPIANGHPPGNEVWMALAPLVFHWAGLPDLAVFRLGTVLALAGTATLLYLLLREATSTAAALAGVLCFAGVPSVWAHGHLAATETIQNFQWVLGAWLLPRALGGRRLWVWAWLAFGTAAFATKFTGLLIPAWVLGAAAIEGAWRRRRFWVLLFLAWIAAPLLLLVVDPFFWPWIGGVPRFADYLKQVTSRGAWVPINSFYLGGDVGFHGPWHYRLVMTAVTTPVVTLLLALLGLAAWARRGPCRPLALGTTGLALTFLVGWLPGTPNHDGTRQFAQVFISLALLGGVGAQFLTSRLRGRARGLGSVGLPLLAGTTLVVALRAEPNGLSYYNEIVGGSSGAWSRGFELSYWMDSVTPALLQRIEALPARADGTRRIHCIPKMNYLAELSGIGDPLLPTTLRGGPAPLRDVVSAYFMPWAVPHRARLGASLGLAFSERPDAILISYRRATVSAGLWNFLDALSRRGELELLGESQVDGVPLGRLYRVNDAVPTRIPEDPENRVWYLLPAVARMAPSAPSPAPGGSRRSG